MKLTRIAKIRHRVFRDFAWPTDLHPFAQFNLVYGWNGSGKTTLSSLFALLEKRSQLAEGEVEFEFDEALKVAGSEIDSKAIPSVRVFNRDFINNTLSSTGGIAPIFFLGEQSVEAQKEVDTLRADLADISAQLEEARAAKRGSEQKLDDFCRDTARTIKELLTTSNSAAYNNYDKRKFKLAIQALDPKTAESVVLEDNRKAQLRSQKDAQPKPKVSEVAAPSIDINALTQEVNRLVTCHVVASVLDELAASPEKSAWVQRGLELHSGSYASDTCHFCHQPLTDTRRSAIEAHFNKAFEAFEDDVEALFEELKAATERVRSHQLPDPSRFYDSLSAKVQSASDSVVTQLAAMAASLESLLARLEKKRDNPFGTHTSVDAVAADTLGSPLEVLNTLIREHNKTTDEFKKSVESACQMLERSRIGEAHAEYTKLTQALSDVTSAEESLRGRLAAVQSQIEERERVILEHRRPADELTSEVSAYLGRHELRFEVKDAGYALTREGKPVTHLSEGERTAIAFLYFLKSLHDKAFDLAKGIVVIDDPVSSLDANTMFSAFGFMKECTKNAGQLFIFTHSFQFFRLVKNWFHHLPKQRSRQLERRPGRFFLLRSRRHVDGSRTSQVGPLDHLLEEHESEYQYLFKRVYDEAHRADVATLEHHYELPNVARRLLESFLAFRFPEVSGELQARLERVNFDSAKKTRILRLLNTYSHAGAISDAEHDLSLLAETQPVLLNILELMRAVDAGHVAGLEKVSCPTSESSDDEDS